MALAPWAALLMGLVTVVTVLLLLWAWSRASALAWQHGLSICERFGLEVQGKKSRIQLWPKGTRLP